jgi:hypothetical protein
MVLMLYVHPERASDLAAPERIGTDRSSRSTSLSTLRQPLRPA